MFVRGTIWAHRNVTRVFQDSFCPGTSVTLCDKFITIILRRRSLKRFCIKYVQGLENIENCIEIEFPRKDFFYPNEKENNSDLTKFLPHLRLLILSIFTEQSSTIIIVRTVNNE